jgi:hypothetical protein
MATICANLAHGLGHGPIGALVSAWPAMALAGSFELLMLLIRTEHQEPAEQSSCSADVPSCDMAIRRAPLAPPLEQTVREWHEAGHSQRAISRELNIDRRKVRQIIEQAE